MTSNPWPATAALALIAAVAACEPGANQNAEPAPDEAAPAASTAPATLAPIDHSGVTGTAVADRDGDDLSVTITVEGLDPGTGYSAAIHEGRCTAGDSERLRLGTFAADEDGMAAATFTTSAAELPAGREWSVQLRSETGATVSCANVLRQ